MLCAPSLSVTEATDGGLKTFLGLHVNCSCQEVPDCWSLTTT